MKGHIGGDDFVIIFDMWDIEYICQQIIDLFKQSIKAFYTENDWQNGFIFSKNRSGVEEKFPIASLSISAVTNKSKVFQSVNEFSKTIASIKKQCKQQEGNFVIIV